MSKNNSKNIEYQTTEIAKFYSNHRNTWNTLYPSERRILESVFLRLSRPSVLDVGCAAGGLGLALCERFKISAYTGIDINEPTIEWARENISLPVPSCFHYGDIVSTGSFKNEAYDLVTGFGVADWNIETEAILSACWKYVKPGGELVISMRLTEDETINDINRSYQFIAFDGPVEKTTDVAPYVVVNVQEIVDLFRSLSPRVARYQAYGYWGKPSEMARTPFLSILFSVFALQKKTDADETPTYDFRLPSSRKIIVSDDQT